MQNCGKSALVTSALLAMCVVAMLLPIHHQPLPHFFTEVGFSIASLLCVLWAVRSAERLVARADGVLLFAGPVVLAAVAQAVFGKAAYSDVLMFCGYALLALVFYQVGCSIGHSQLRSKHIRLIAWTILSAAVLSGLVGAFQVFHQSLPFGLIYRAGNVIYGNLAQANHFNDLMWLGIVSVLFLRGRSGSGRWWAAGAIAWLLIFSALSTSRSGILYSFVVASLPLLMRRAGSSWRDQCWAFAMLPAYLAVLAIFSWFDVAHHFGLMQVAERFPHTGSAAYSPSGEMRFGLWANLMHAMQFTGIGVGAFADTMRFRPENWLSTGFSGPPEHPHNEFIALGFELGWWVVVLALGLLGRWVWRRRHAQFDTADLWAMGIVGVIGIHAMLEYPLRYVYFLIPFSMALGFLSSRAPPKTLYAVPRHFAAALPLAALLLVLVAFVQFSTIDGILFGLQSGDGFGGRDKAVVFVELDEVSSLSPFKRYASLIKGLVASPEDIRGGKLLNDCDGVVRVWLSARSLGNCASSYMLHAAPDKAAALLKAVCVSDSSSFPEVLQRFQAVTGVTALPPGLPSCSTR